MVSGQVLLLIYTICKYYIEIILSIYLQNEVCKKFSSIRLRYA